jgi:hypothetical protein
MSQVHIRSRRRPSRWLKAVMVSALGLGLVAPFLLLAFFWPFRLETVTKELADESDSRVTAGSFRATYFPHPGCVLEQVIFQHNLKSGTPPLIIVKRITIRGTFAGIFARHVKLVLVEGMHILIPPLGSEPFKTPQRSSVVMDDLKADGAVLEVESRDSVSPPLQFLFHAFESATSAATFRQSLRRRLQIRNPREKSLPLGSLVPGTPTRWAKRR